jgi:hypothetical protein
MKGYIAAQRNLLCLTYTLWKTDTEFKDNFQSKAPKILVEKYEASLLDIVSKEISPLTPFENRGFLLKFLILSLFFSHIASVCYTKINFKVHRKYSQCSIG